MNPPASSADNTDQEGETFEDAPDSKPSAEQKDPRSARNSKTITGEITSSESTIKAPTQEPAIQPAPQPSNPDSEKLWQAVENQKDTTSAEAASPKSPLLTAHRMSTSTDEKSDENSVRARDSQSSRKGEDVAGSPVEVSEKVTETTPVPPKPSTHASRFTSFSAALPWGGPAKPSATSAPSAPTHARKITGPFGWLNRTPSAPKDGNTPLPQAVNPSMDRRNTSTSISTIGSNPELMIKTLDDGEITIAGHKPPARSTLRDRFKLLRMREEAGITELDNPQKTEGGAIAGLIGRTTSLGIGVASPTSMTDKESSQPTSPVTSPHPVPALSVDTSLAPGTVSGISAPPSSTVQPIDWDFWQTVVNDGPQVVARTSPAELAQSIASGIPQTIRGVIWQVLASSKNEDLEAVYYELLVTGTDKEVKDVRPELSQAGQGHDVAPEKGSIASSRSSVHSDPSTPATSTNVGISSPTASVEHNRDSDLVAKAQAKLKAGSQKKAQDNAALQRLEKAIKRDMGSRTSYSKYAVAAGFQDGLFNICKAYALYDEAVGYPQGMNFIIMPILFTMPAEEAFCLLVRLMNKYGLRELFINDMPGLHLHLYEFERLLEDLEPALYCHLNRRGVTPKLYATQWFLTLFAYRFPLQLVLRVIDLVLSEGLEAAILKIGMAVVQRNASTLMGMNDMGALTNFLKDKLFDVYIDQAPSNKSILESGFFGSSGGTDTEIYRADILVQEACSVRLTPEMLKTYRTEWSEKTRTEKEREVEFDTNKATISSQTAKIRSLEERAEKSDTEHVQIATDLVRIKVENQELTDGNESLQGQVDELKKVAESEGAKVESRLKEEMERVMQRNIEVQNENRLMEESIADMEADLVSTKMKYAEVMEHHEALKLKWNDLRKALD